MTRAAIIGSGSWGTAFGKILADGGTDVVLWARRPELAEAITVSRSNPDYLPGIALPHRLSATADMVEALDGADLVVLAVPSQTLRDNLAEASPHIPPQAVLVSLMKGVELGTTKRMSEVIREVADVPAGRVAVVTGPNLAREIAEEQPTATVVASTDLEVGRELMSLLRTPYFKPYVSSDVVGCELGGAVKNVIALAVGMAEGLGFGDNTKASLITRGLAETARLGVALGAEAMTFSGLAGMGDLVATCSSPLSRNHRFGASLGRGATVESLATQPHLTAEGYKSCRSILALGLKHAVDMPITEHVVAVCYEGMPVLDMVGGLMSREATTE